MTLLLLVAAAWLIVTALLVRGQVNALKLELPQLRDQISAGHLDQAEQTAAELRSHAARAHSLTSGPAWWSAQGLPWIGDSVHSVRTLAAESHLLARDVIPGVLQLGGDLTSGKLRSDGQINLQPLIAAQPVLRAAAGAAATATTRVSQLPKHTAVSSVDSARTTLATYLVQIRDQLQTASSAAQIMPSFLGQDGLKRYFVGFLNDAEARGVGGLPGAYAIMTADHGKIGYTYFGNDYTFDGYQAHVAFPADYLAVYGRDDPTAVYVNSDVSPDFSAAAQIWASMWQQKSGEHIDGAIALDPTALGELLAVTGPIPTDSGTAITADNVVALTEQQLYALYPDTDNRKAFLLSVAQAVSHQLLAAGDSTQLARAVVHAGRERRLLVYSSDPVTEAQLTTSGFAGALPGTDAPATGFAVVNAAGTKLDYYLDRTMTYEQTSCAAGTAKATLTLHNGAPTSGLPPYVTTRFDSDAATSKPGDNRLLVTYYGSAGSTQPQVTLDGRPVSFSTGTEKGLTLVTVDLELPVGASRTLVVTLTQPASTKAVQTFQQPLVRPLRMSISQPSCS